MLTIREETEKMIENLLSVLDGLPEEQPWQELIDAAKVNLCGCIQLAISKMRLPMGMKTPVKIKLLKVPSLSDEHAAASIGIPEKLYFRSEINTTLTIREDCCQNPECFVCVILHELSHLYLKILNCDYWNQEKYVDLTPMVMGFSGAVRKGRKNGAHTMGYLTDSEFEAADSYIKRQRERGDSMKNTLNGKLNVFSETLRQASTALSDCKAYLSKLYKVRHMTFHDAGRLAMLSSCEGLLKSESILTRLEKVYAHADEHIKKNISFPWAEVEVQVSKGILEARTLVSSLTFDFEFLVDMVHQKNSLNSWWKNWWLGFRKVA